MRLRDQVLIIALPVLLIPMILVILLARFSLLKSYEQLELKNARENVLRSIRVFDYELENLLTTTVDWAWWDDMRDFVLDPNSGFIETNFTPSTFSELNINLVQIVDAEGLIVFKDSFDPESGTRLTFSDQAHDQLNSSIVHIQQIEPRAEIAGLIFLQDRPFIIAAAPILDSDGMGPRRGTLFFGRLVDDAFQKQLIKTTNLPIQLLTPGESGFDEELLSLAQQENGYLDARIVDSQTVVGSSLINDIFGNPGIILKITELREITRSGLASVSYLIFFMLVFSFVVISAALFILNKFIVEPILVLNNNTQRIGLSGNHSIRLAVEGSNEIRQLTQSINMMLAGLQHSELALRQSEERYRDIVEAQSELVCRWGLDGKITFVNEAFCNYFEASRQSFIGSDFLSLFQGAGCSLEQIAQTLTDTPLEVKRQVRSISASSQLRWLLWVDRPLYDANHRLEEILSVGRDITEREELENALKWRVEFERLVAEISSNFVNITSDRIDSTIELMLQKIGVFTGADRSYIFKIDYDERVLSNTYEWCADGINPEIDHLKSISFSEIPWWMEELSHLKPIRIPVVSDLPEQAQAEKQHLQRQGIQSLLAVPMYTGSNLVGFLGLDSVREKKEWSEDILRVLRLMADILTNALEKLRSDEQLLAQQRRLVLVNEITQAALIATCEQSIFQAAAEKLANFLDADTCLIYLLDPVNPAIETCVAFGENVEGWQFFSQNPDGFKSFQRFCQNGKAFFISDLKQSDEIQLPFQETYQSLYAFPLLESQHSIGAVVVLFKKPIPLSVFEVEVCEQAADQISLAVMKIRALGDARKRLEEAETLREAASLVAATLEPEEAVNRILDELGRVIPYDSASIQLLGDGYLEIIGGRGWKNINNVIGIRFPVPGDTPNSIVIQKKAPYILNDAPSVYENFRKIPHDHIQSWMGVPLIVRGDLIGMFAIDHRQPDYFQNDHIQLVSAFADQVAVLLDNARLFKNAQRRAQELDALRATVTDLTAELDLSALLKSIVERATSLLNVTGGELGLYDPDDNMLEIVVSHNLGENFFGERIDLGEGVMGYVAEALEPISVEDYMVWSGRSPKYTQIRLHACAAAPLLIGGRLLGVIGVGTTDPRHRIEKSDLLLLNLFAQQAAIAVENAQLFQIIQTQAITDPLTGLYNRRGLFDLGKREIELAFRKSRPFSVLLFDIDHFKRINDHFSHAVGDEVLRELGNIFRDTLRKSDILGRYGGEEFAVLLPETDLEEACSIANRFRLRVAEQPIRTRNGKLNVTVSCGVTSTHNEIRELAVLIDQADTALYQAKQSGRNQVCIYERILA